MNRSYIKHSIILAVVFLFGFSTPSIAATLKLSPANKSSEVGQTFSVDILLDTEGVAIDGLDIYSLRFNPKILEVVDANPQIDGIQITAGKDLPLTVMNSVNNAAGTVQFSQIVTGGSSFTGKSKVASILFKTKAEGSSNVSFDFTPGKTSDTNVAGTGIDLLSSVGNGSYTVTASSSSSNSEQENEQTTSPIDENPQNEPQPDSETPDQSTQSTPTNSSINWPLWIVLTLVALTAASVVFLKLKNKNQ